MSQKICNRPLNITYGDLRTSAEGDNSIQRHSQLFVQVAQHTWEDCSNTGANTWQPDIRRALAIVQVALEGHKDVLAVQFTAHFRSLAWMNICLRSDNSVWYVTGNFHSFKWELHAGSSHSRDVYSRGFEPSVPANWCRITLKARGVWPRPSMFLIHLTTRGYKAIYLVCFNGCQ